MGNRQSQAGLQKPTQTASNESSDVGGRVVLSDDLTDEIHKTFESKLLQDQWNEFQKTLLSARQQRRTNAEVNRSIQEENMKLWKEQNQQKQEYYDQAISDAQAKFNQYENEMRSNLQSFTNQLESAPKFGDSSNACLQVRKDVANCFKDSGNLRTCDDFIAGLEECTKKTVVGHK